MYKTKIIMRVNEEKQEKRFVRIGIREWEPVNRENSQLK